jgi:Uma2 family endonuclease
MATPTVKLTCDDLLRFPDDGKRHELIDGEHYVTPSPNTSHQQIAGNLYFLIRSYLQQQPRGQVFVAPFDVVLSNLDVVEPDLLYIAKERAEILTPQHVRGAPNLVIEVLSPATRKTDETRKRKLYERFAVDEYWIVDPEAELLKVYRRSGTGYALATELTREEQHVIETPLFPGLRLALADVFAQPQ